MQALKRSYLLQITFSKEWWLEDFKSVRTNDDWSFTRMLLALKNNFGIARDDFWRRCDQKTTVNYIKLLVFVNLVKSNSDVIHPPMAWMIWMWKRYTKIRILERFSHMYREAMQRASFLEMFHLLCLCRPTSEFGTHKSFVVKYFTNFRWTSSRVIAWKTFIHHE